MPPLPRKVETFVQSGIAIGKGVARGDLAPVQNSGLRENEHLKRAQNVRNGQLPILSYRRRISDPMWTVCGKNVAAQVITGRYVLMN